MIAPVGSETVSEGVSQTIAHVHSLQYLVWLPVGVGPPIAFLAPEVTTSVAVVVDEVPAHLSELEL